MRAFIVISFLLACANAAPQYGYEQPGGGGIGAIGGGISSIGGVGGVGGAGGLTGSDLIGLPGPGANAHRGGDKYLPPASTTPTPIVNKKFYLISAPEDHSNDNKVKHLVLGRPQRNYRVVFIKAPGSDNANLKLSAEFAPQEEKTVIYVLSKKNNELEANDIATPAPTQPSKPEVFFIKYKTDDEAQQAQKEIQGQYDKLGGTNEYNEETSAPVTSIIGSLDGLNPDGSYNYRQISGGAAGPAGAPTTGSRQETLAPSSQYLPALFKH